jgi:hypothetical protein
MVFNYIIGFLLQEFHDFLDTVHIRGQSDLAQIASNVVATSLTLGVSIVKGVSTLKHYAGALVGQTPLPDCWDAPSRLYLDRSDWMVIHENQHEIKTIYLDVNFPTNCDLSTDTISDNHWAPSRFATLGSNSVTSSSAVSSSVTSPLSSLPFWSNCQF